MQQTEVKFNNFLAIRKTDILRNTSAIFSVDNFCTKILVVENNWLKVLEQIKSQVTPANFRTWFSKTIGETTSSGDLIIKVPSSFIKDQLQTKLQPTLLKSIEEIFNYIPKIEFKVDPGLDQKNENKEESFEFIPSSINNTQNGLNSRYTLDNFVVGLSNSLAYAAAQAVVQNPGVSYNPLFVYGGTGVGKTHLMQGIGNALFKKQPHIKVIYCSTERFMNDFVQSIQSKTTTQFRMKYRLLDLLLIDDIQFISGRDSTQEEFFHTFNELQTKNCQVILTSDRPPNEIQKLESRLASRFQGGLMVDIQLPDFDTRAAILKAKCSEQNINISSEILNLLAENITTNARELEGKFTRIIQSHKLLHQPLTFDSVKVSLGQIPDPNYKLEYKKVIQEINQYFNIKMVDITGPRRKKELVLPRQLAMYILYEECKLPYERIGDVLGGRDHTTIMHGVEKIKQVITRDREIQRMLIEIKQKLSTPIN